MPDIPLSLYIHLPWCVRKCPYCDFNSHAAGNNPLPEAAYVAALLEELDSQLPLLSDRTFTSLFFGGGTPSLFSPAAIHQILSGIDQRVSLTDTPEITLEANPGTVDEARFRGFREAGINRLSLGIQSFQPEKLKALGRIHGRAEALRAAETARQAGFDNINLDIMHGLPAQTVPEALDDLETALQCAPTHLSWYQLTLEPHTLFYRHPPVLPDENTLHAIQLAGENLLKARGFGQYEVSAWCLPDRECLHNRNYWEFGDYLGIGAGAHSKLTTKTGIVRRAQHKHPRDYLDPLKRRVVIPTPIPEKSLPLEFMLNALRLVQGVPSHFFPTRTGLSLACITPILASARTTGLLKPSPHQLCATAHGLRFLNDLTGMFL